MALAACRLFVALTGLLVLSSEALAQSPPTPAPVIPATLPTIEGRKAYHFVTKMPVYLDGGMDGLQAFVASNVRGSSSGPKAYVTFIVDRTGKLRTPAFGPNSAESDAAVAPELAAAFRSVGLFRPGYHNGKPVDVVLTVPLVKRVKKQSTR